MPNKMLIDASHPEETRVVVVRGNRIEEFDFESQDKKQLKGNIYLARVTRVEPSLQAAFVEYGGNRHGFLAFSEIHPDYYQIPVADRQALLRAEAEAAQEEARAEDEAGEEGGDGQRSRRRRRGGKNRSRGDEHEASGGEEAAQAAEVENDDVVSEEHSDEAETADSSSDNGNGDDANGDEGNNGNGNGGSDHIESVGAEDALEEARERRRPLRRQYKIQEVVKRRQILLVQVVKEERGNKGAALTTYLSLAGRYSVLMPNTARGGGISRKITNAQNRKRLKEIVKDLDVPQGMGVILRTAGEARTKAEIKRDYEYLMRLWDNVRELTLKSTAPALVYEEGSLIKRSVRDLYNKDIDEIQVAGEEGYREAKDFMRMLMPSHAKVVQPYRENTPIFARSGIEAQLDRMLQPQVTLKSGGYIILNQTEALVAIDVNSGRSTREHSIEDTALQTNLEAADEVARQLRLRDLAGLIVIDFIDMEENRNNRAVEKRLKDCLKNDRARIQVGRISHFGLLEMSRQRIRASVLESTTQTCPYCGGAGHVRSESSVALMVIRAIEEFLLKDARNNITVRTPVSTAIYVLNHKRSTLAEMEARFGLRITIEADDSVHAQHYVIAKGAPAERPAGIEPPPLAPLPEEEDEIEQAEVEDEAEADATAERHAEDGERKRRRRRRRRGGRDRDRAQQAEPQAEGGTELAEPSVDYAEADGPEPQAEADDEQGGGQKKRRRGKRGGRRGRGHADADAAEAGADEAVAEDAGTAGDAAPAAEEVSDHAVMKAVEAGEPAPGPVAEAPAEEEQPPAEKKARKPRASRAKPKPVEPEVETAVEDLEGSKDGAEEEPAAEAKPARRRAPRRKAAAEDAPAETASAPVDAADDVAPPPAADEVIEEQSPEQEEAPAPGPEPVVVSEEPAQQEDKPRKTGWWQRKGFL